MVILDRLQDDLGRVPVMELLAGGTMGMNADGDLVLVAELVEALETIGGGIGTEHLEAECFAEIEGAFVGVVIPGEALDAPGPGGHAVLLADGEERLDCLRLVGYRAVLLVELAVLQAEFLHPLEGL